MIACNGTVPEGTYVSCRAVETILPVSSLECVYFTNIPGGWVQEILPFFCPWNSPGKNTGGGCHSLLQGIFPTQGLNLGLLHCRQILTVWASRESPLHFIGEIKWVLPPGLLFSSLLLCNKPSPNLRPKQHIYFAHKSSLWTDLHGEVPPLTHLVQGGVAWRL